MCKTLSERDESIVLKLEWNLIGEAHMKTLGKLMMAGLFVFAFLQLIRPSIPEGPKGVELQAPPGVKHVIEKDCYSCHSNRARLSWFDQIVPGYWLVRYDILAARQHLNF